MAPYFLPGVLSSFGRPAPKARIEIVILNEAHCLTGNTMSFCARHALAPLVTARSHATHPAGKAVAAGDD